MRHESVKKRLNGYWVALIFIFFSSLFLFEEIMSNIFVYREAFIPF